MKKSLIFLFVLLQLIVSCASHHHDRFPSSEDVSNDDFYNRNPRFRS